MTLLLQTARLWPFPRSDVGGEWGSGSGTSPYQAKFRCVINARKNGESAMVVVSPLRTFGSTDSCKKRLPGTLKRFKSYLCAAL